MKELILNFTEKCNGRCTTCNIWKIKEPKTLSDDILSKLFKSSRLNGLQNVYLTGGEPFIDDTCIDIAAYVGRYFPGAIITGATNCVMPYQYFERIWHIKNVIGVNVIPSISLDGNEKFHDKIRGIKGNYKNALILMDMLKRDEFIFDIAMLLTSNTNAKQISHVEEIAEMYGAGIGVTRQLNGKRYGNGFVLSDFEHAYFIINNCPAMKDVICVWPNGDVTACEVGDDKLLVGNLYEENLDDMDEWDKVDKFIRKRKCQPCPVYCFVKKGNHRVCDSNNTIL